MRKTISVYWPVILIVPFSVIAFIHAWQTAEQTMPLAASQLTAELARDVSWGLVGNENVAPVRAAHDGVSLMPARAL